MIFLRMVFLRALAVWLGFMTAESLNGVLRELWLVPALGNLQAHQLSFFTGLGLILLIVTLTIRWIHASGFSELVQVGLFWLMLTLGFEIGLGRLLGYSWPQILADYDPSQGGLMGFGLVLLALAPLIATKLRPSQDQPA